MTKTIDESFLDWESEAFGYGYGTGEEHTLGALRDFMLAIPERQYDYEVLENALTPRVAWLMINALCKDGVIEYGTSPRYGWLTPAGERLRAYVLSKTVDELYEIRSDDDDYVNCYKTACNCGPEGYDPNRVCDNPFWGRHA